MPCGPLADDWFFWDPETIFAYPHSRESRAEVPGVDEACADRREPVQLELFHGHNDELPPAATSFP